MRRIPVLLLLASLLPAVSHPASAEDVIAAGVGCGMTTTSAADSAITQVGILRAGPVIVHNLDPGHTLDIVITCTVQTGGDDARHLGAPDAAQYRFEIPTGAAVDALAFAAPIDYVVAPGDDVYMCTEIKFLSVKSTEDKGDADPLTEGHQCMQAIAVPLEEAVSALEGRMAFSAGQTGYAQVTSQELTDGESGIAAMCLQVPGRSSDGNIEFVVAGSAVVRQTNPGRAVTQVSVGCRFYSRDDYWIALPTTAFPARAVGHAALSEPVPEDSVNANLVVLCVRAEVTYEDGPEPPRYAPKGCPTGW